MFASTITQPQNVWTSAGTESNFNYSIPNQDKTASSSWCGGGGDAIRHIVPMDDLILLTAASLWRTGDASGVDPSTIGARPQVCWGGPRARYSPVICSTLPPVGAISASSATSDKNGYTSGDISIRAPPVRRRGGRQDVIRADPLALVWAVDIWYAAWFNLCA